MHAWAYKRSELAHEIDLPAALTIVSSAERWQRLQHISKAFWFGQMVLLLFNKPFQVMCQFSAHPTRASLAQYIDHPGMYPAGRLDADSEGLMLLTADGMLQHRISHPSLKAEKTYLVQVEGEPDAQKLQRLRGPLYLGDFTTLPCRVAQVEMPSWLWQREPPIRVRKAAPTHWLSIIITEGKNRQIRRMTAQVGLPTLRLIRTAIGPFSLATHPLWPGQYCSVSPERIWRRSTVT